MNKREGKVCFTKVALPYGWLGNMSNHSVTYEGKVYPRTEHLFQALRFDDVSIRARIRAETNPMKAKFLAKKHIGDMTTTQLSKEDVSNMKLVVWLKLYYNPELVQLLLDTGDKEIVEDVSDRSKWKGGSDLFWGKGVALSNKDKVSPFWVGNNMLGEIWMEWRNLIKKSLKVLASGIFTFDKVNKDKWTFENYGEKDYKITSFDLQYIPDISQHKSKLDLLILLEIANKIRIDNQ